MTKKVLVLSLALSSVLFGCVKDNDDELAELKARLEAIEKGKTVTSITFEGTNMVITYNTGDKLTLPIPGGIKGDTGPAGPAGPAGPTGAAGANGVGIASITYNETTGILTIKLTNGNESSFQVVTSADGSLSAVLLSDTKGKQLISSIFAGAAPYLEMTYDPTTFEAATAKSSDIVSGQIRKSMEASKSYTAGKLTGALIKRFAVDKRIAYSSTYLSGSNTMESFATSKGTFYTEGGTDGLYTLYVYSNQNGGTYNYFRYPNAVKTTTALPGGYGFVKYSENIVYYSSTSISVPGSTDFWYKAGERYIKMGVTNPGDVISTENYTIETNADGLVSKSINTTKQRSITFTYNAAKKVSQAVEHINTVVGRTMNYEYNTANQLVSVKEVEGGTTTEVVKAEYDANGNPVKIYTYQSALRADRYNEFDPWDNPTNPWEPVTRPAGMYLFATLEYTNYKNFFGHTFGAVFPGLGAYNFNNAPKRVSYANSVTFGSIDYKDFNEFGYPQTIVTNAASTADGSGSVRIELSANYIKKTN